MKRKSERKVSTFKGDFPRAAEGVCFRFGGDGEELHVHDYWELCCVSEGELVLLVEGGEERIGPGELVLLPPGRPHGAGPVRPLGPLFITATSEAMEKLTENFGPGFADALRRGNVSPCRPDEGQRERLTYALTLLQTMREEDPEIGILLKLLLLGTLEALYLKTIGRTPGYPEWLNRFLLRLRQPELLARPVHELYLLTPFSHSHLERLFKQHTGKTLVAHLAECKLLYAASLLRTSDLTVLEISGRVGYTSLSHFNRVFRTEYGQTPTDYRARFR